ncbi:hypothetical protein OESDEN_17661 [Oesophagostomum dentatum]|uniref:Uncharacterized protein n=1 Tax=Oesophagostomum dentatum TaxID=61180 RepID=A0A0B1SHL0_OESDE|nr:hypothetical protein OESDEN_17661 [Oesophagostomum dentatum]
MVVKHRRGFEPTEEGTSSSTSSSSVDEVQSNTSQQSILHGESPAKRKRGRTKVVRFAGNADEPGPSFVDCFEAATEDVNSAEHDVAEVSDAHISEMTE